MRHTLDFDASIPKAKRQKITSSDHSPDPIQSTAEKELERLNPEEYILERVEPFQKPSQPLPSKSLGSGMYVNGIPSINNRVKEYLLVENTMNSSGKKKAKHRGNRFRSNFSAASNTPGIPITSASSESNLIDLSGDDVLEEVKKEQRSLTAFPDIASDRKKATLITAGVNELSRSRETGERSRHFADPQIRNFQTTSQNTLKSQNGSLARQFKDTNGKRRSIDLSSYSSDELGSATTVGVVVNKSPERQLTPKPKSRYSSRTKHPPPTQKAMTPTEDEVSVPPSNLPATKFLTSRANRQSQKLPAIRKNYAQEKRAPWGIPLAGLTVAGKWKRSQSLGLELDEDTQSYVFVDGGRNFTAIHPSLRIQPEKLRKVTWAESGGKIRFESCKSGNNDTKLDLEIQSEKDLHDLLMKLPQSNTLMILNKPRNFVERMFSTNLSEQEKALISPRPVVKEMPDDVLLAARHVQRRDEAKAKERPEQSMNKRPRMGQRIIDKLNGGSYQDSTSQVPQVQSKTTSIFKDTLGDDTSNVENVTLNCEVDHFAALEKVLAKAQTQNSHIPRSQIETRAMFRRPKEPSPVLDEFPEEERYSRRFDLGPRWTKSLIYPKVGKKKSTIDWSDLERLDEGQYLNDNLIGFYLRFLERQAEKKNPDLLKKVYFFNTFFFASLTNTQRGKKPINYEGVQKWTRGIDLFTYDYVVVPINEATHWYVAIICNLPELIQDTAKDGTAVPPQSDFENGGETLNERPFETVDPVSSPSALVEQPNLLVPRNDEPQERDPTASFADMSLETDAEKSPAKDSIITVGADVITANEAKEKDQEMLDAQLIADITENPTIEDAGPPEVPTAETEKVESTAEDQSPKASFSKKRKHKSIPPIKKIDATEPAIITFDSLGASHPPTIRILKSYIREEGTAKRNGMEFDESRLKGLTAKQIPQQDNFSDCGLFLLGYMEKFLENPKEFIEKVVKREYDIKRDWPKMDPSKMRNTLRTLVQELHGEQENERQREKTETARKTGKLVTKQQPEAEPHPSSDPLHADETHQQLTTALSGRTHTEEAHTSPRTTETRKDALHEALPIDSQEPSKAPSPPTDPSPETKPTKTHPNAPLPSPTLPKNPSIILSDSQPDSIGSSSLQPKLPAPRPSSPELATEIADSQPPADPPSSPPTLPKRQRHTEEEHLLTYDGLPLTSSMLDQAIAEIEEPRERRRRGGHGKDREGGRGRRRSVVEIDD